MSPVGLWPQPFTGYAPTYDRCMTQPLLDRPTRTAVVCVLMAGAGLAISGLVASLIHDQSGQAIAYVVVTVALTAVTVFVARQVRWVTIVCLVGLAGQGIAVVGTVWELTHPTTTAKAVQLQAIGIDPTWATTVNLIYSATAFGVFCWIAARRWARMRNPAATPKPRPDAFE
jgi:hypothetical protein